MSVENGSNLESEQGPVVVLRNGLPVTPIPVSGAARESSLWGIHRSGSLRTGSLLANAAERNQFLKDAICVRELEKDFRGFKAINKLSLRVKRVLRRGVWIGKPQIAAREPVIRANNG